MRYRTAQWAHHPKIIERTPAGTNGAGSPPLSNSTTSRPGSSSCPFPVTPAGTQPSRWHRRPMAVARRRRLLPPWHLDGDSRVPAILRAGETLVAYDLKRVRDNHTRAQSDLVGAPSW